MQKSGRRQVDGSGEVGCCDNGARFLADDAYGRTDALVDLPRLGAAQRLDECPRVGRARGREL
ncbi:hypothetical protein [Rhodococcoides fascians]|uniref:hypothetical protein n=1 Tax=Rhodococcoides fascians TaxID=1828 RepID=UPI000A84C47F|nr:hypothetical protein [Rhodococcus fascians]